MIRPTRSATRRPDQMPHLENHAARRRRVEQLDACGRSGAGPCPGRPSPAFLSNPIVLFTSVIFSFFAVAFFAVASSPWRYRASSPPRSPSSSLPRSRRTDRRIAAASVSAGERRAHDVVRVGRSERLGQHVLNAARLDHGAHRAAGDDAGAVRRRLEQHLPGAEAAEHRVRHRRALRAARGSATSSPPRSPFLIADGTSFALPTPKPTTPWPSPTTTSALKLRFLPPLTTLVTRLMLTTVSFRSSCDGVDLLASFNHSSIRVLRSCPLLELQPGFARRFRHRADAAVIQVAAAVEHHARDALGVQPLGDRLAERLGARPCCRRAPCPRTRSSAPARCSPPTPACVPLMSSMTCA